MLDLLPDPTSLLNKALLDRGEAMVVIADPAAGDRATIQSANEPWSRLVGRADGFVGRALGELEPLVLLPSQWRAFATALRRYAPIQLDLTLRVDGRERCLQVRLAFDEDGDGHAGHALLLGRDISKARRRESEEGTLQRLLGGVFLEMSAPVAVLAEDGSVMMSNPAFEALLGYGAEGVEGKPIGALIAPDHQVAAAAARAKQIKLGGRFDLRVDLLHRAGHRVPVRMTCALLDEADRRVRVVTALPEAAAERADRGASAAKLDLYGAAAQPQGEVLAISLQALRAACAADWARIAPRAALLVEGALKRRLGPADVFSRTDDDGFVIWFDCRESARNAATLAGIVREIRLRLVVELGGQVPAPALAVLSAREPAEGAFRPSDPASHARQDPLGTAMQPVMDREGNARPWCFAEPPRGSCRHTGQAGAGLEAAAEADLRACDLALAEAAAQPRWDKVFVRVGWACLATPGTRRMMDDWLGRAPASVRARLAFVVSGVPPVPNPRRWLDVVSPLRPLLADVIPSITLAPGDDDRVGEAVCAWPVGWLALDGADSRSVPPDGYFRLIATARRREITVLARAAGPADIRDWRELGANLIVAAGREPP